MVVVNGEAGIGKSRITRAVIDEIAGDDHVRITYQCSPYHTESAFYPVIQQMAYAAGFKATDGAEARLDKMETLIGDDPETRVLAAAMLGMDTTKRYGALDLAPAQQRARTMQVVARLLVQQAREKPLLLVYEDLHWVDPTSLELLDIVLDAITDQRVLILATARPTFGYGFGGHPIVTWFALNRLGKEQIGAIASKLAGGKALPDEIMEIIANRTDGVPLFVEELTKTILESGALKEDGDRFVLDGPLSTIAIPATLHDSLMARLDRLQPIKGVAQTAACIGREFGHGLLAQISHLPEAELGAAMDGLIKAELIYRRGLPPEAIYLFKHALVRDAAYESLLKGRRRAVHTRILAALENDPDIAPEVLAVHAEAAGQTEQAIDLWEVAGKAAIARPAYDEGISQLEHAISLIAPQVKLGGHEALERALSLQVQIGVALLARKGYSADEPKAAFDNAMILVDRIGDTPMRHTVLYGLWAGRFVRAEHVENLKHGEALIRLSEKSAETATKVVGLRTFGVTNCLMGRFAEAQGSVDQALALYDSVAHAGMENRFGQDIGVTVHCYLAINLAMLGETRRASAHAIEAERIALATNHANTICYMRLHLSCFELFFEDEKIFSKHVEAIALIADEHKLSLWSSWARLLEALVVLGNGDPSGFEDFQRADANYLATKSKVFLPYIRTAACWRALALGLREQAAELSALAQDMIAETGEKFALSDLHRLQAALALDAQDDQTAETCLREAIDVARDQGARIWELRAAIDLARLWHNAGRTREAISLLKPVHDSIADGDCPKDMITAHELITEFAG
jgi:ABC-type transport system involved in cytochrome c biogenesis ATPase subunit/tetratricopeptide (TPR) repeat protein